LPVRGRNRLAVAVLAQATIMRARPRCFRSDILQPNKNKYDEHAANISPPADIARQQRHLCSKVKKGLAHRGGIGSMAAAAFMIRDGLIAGIHRVMSALKMTDEISAPKSQALPKSFLGNENTSLRATVGGFVEYKVGLLDIVVKDQLLARQMNAFGETIAEYKAPHDGKVLSVGDEPVREPGALVVRLIRWNPSEKCKLGC
jgi:hypothetical protein